MKIFDKIINFFNSISRYVKKTNLEKQIKERKIILDRKQEEFRRKYDKK